MGNSHCSGKDKAACVNDDTCTWNELGSCGLKSGRQDYGRQAGNLNGLPVEIVNLVAAAYDKLEKQQD